MKTTLSPKSNAGSINQESRSLYALLEQIEDKVSVSGTNSRGKETEIFIHPTIMTLHKKICKKYGQTLKRTFKDYYHEYNATVKETDMEVLPYIDCITAFQSQAMILLESKKINRPVNNVQGYIFRTIPRDFITMLFRQSDGKVAANTSCVGNDTFKLENITTGSYQAKLGQKSERYSERSDDEIETGNRLSKKEFDELLEKLCRLARLNDNQRKTFLHMMHSDAERSSELAKELERPAESIYRDKHRACQRIKDALKTPVGRKVWKSYMGDRM